MGPENGCHYLGDWASIHGSVGLSKSSHSTCKQCHKHRYPHD